MKPLFSALSLASLVAVSAYASAAPTPFKGSDTLFGVVNDAVNQLGLEGSLQYLGGGSGTGEAGLLAQTQGIAPMSRAVSAAARTTAAAKGILLVEHAIGLDGVSIFVKKTESVFTISLPVLRSIYAGEDGTGSAASCAAPARVTRFEQIPGVTAKTGSIRAIRRNDDSGTTDAFKSLVGITAFCGDVVIKATTEEIKNETSTDASALGFAGESGENRAGNKALAVAKTATGVAVTRTVASVRDLTYPLTRRLYINVGTSAARPLTNVETTLLDNLLDPSFTDPLLEANGFVTCPNVGLPVAGCN
jgi:phosphate transport system substrate-binding protein